MTLSDRVRDMAQKLQLVAEQMQTLRSDNSALRRSNQDLSTRLDQAAAALEKVQAFKTEAEEQVANGLEAPKPEHTEKLREQIEHYIAEVDRCIDWLRKH